MKLFRKMKAGIKLLAILEPFADQLATECPRCRGRVVLFFDQEAKFKPYFPSHEACLLCDWTRPFAELQREING